MLPGDPVRALFGFRQPTPEAYARVQAQLRLDRPVLEQYVLYLRDVVHLDLGRTFPRDPYGRPEPGAEVWDARSGRPARPARSCWAGRSLVQAVVGVVAGALAAARAGTARPVGRRAWRCWLVVHAGAGRGLRLAHRLRRPAGPAARRRHRRGWQGYVLPVLSLAALSAGYLALLLKGELLVALRAPYDDGGPRTRDLRRGG